MKSNVGAVDRVVRVVLAALAWWLAATVGYGTVGGVILLIVTAVLVLTAAVGYCPLYTLASVSTRGGWHRTRTAHV